jgi:hypothetical protein
MYKLILMGFLLAATSVALGGDNDEGLQSDDVVDWTAADRDLSFSEWRTKSEALRERDRAASAAEEASLPKLRDASLHDHTDSFPVKIRLNDNQDAEKWLQGYLFQGATVNESLEWRGPGLVKDVDDDGKETGRTHWENRGIQVFLTITPDMLRQLEDDPAVKLVYDSSRYEDPEKNLIRQSVITALPDIEATSSSLE